MFPVYVSRYCFFLIIGTGVLRLSRNCVWLNLKNGSFCYFACRPKFCYFGWSRCLPKNPDVKFIKSVLSKQYVRVWTNDTLGPIYFVLTTIDYPKPIKFIVCSYTLEMYQYPVSKRSQYLSNYQFTPTNYYDEIANAMVLLRIKHSHIYLVRQLVMKRSCLQNKRPVSVPIMGHYANLGHVFCEQ